MRFLEAIDVQSRPMEEQDEPTQFRPLPTDNFRKSCALTLPDGHAWRNTYIDAREPSGQQHDQSGYSSIV